MLRTEHLQILGIKKPPCCRVRKPLEEIVVRLSYPLMAVFVNNLFILEATVFLLVVPVHLFVVVSSFVEWQGDLISQGVLLEKCLVE